MPSTRTGTRTLPGMLMFAGLMAFGVNVAHADDQMERPSFVPPDQVQSTEQSAAPPIEPETISALTIEPESFGGTRRAPSAGGAPERPARTTEPRANWWSWAGQAPPRHSPLQTLTPRGNAGATDTVSGERERIPGPCCRSIPVLEPDTALSLI